MFGEVDQLTVARTLWARSSRGFRERLRRLKEELTRFIEESINTSVAPPAKSPSTTALMSAASHSCPVGYRSVPKSKEDGSLWPESPSMS